MEWRHQGRADSAARRSACEGGNACMEAAGSSNHCLSQKGQAHPPAPHPQALTCIVCLPGHQAVPAPQLPVRQEPVARGPLPRVHHTAETSLHGCGPLLSRLGLQARGSDSGRGLAAWVGGKLVGHGQQKAGVCILRRSTASQAQRQQRQAGRQAGSQAGRQPGRQVCSLGRGELWAGRTVSRPQAFAKRSSSASVPSKRSAGSATAFSASMRRISAISAPYTAAQSAAVWGWRWWMAAPSSS